MTHAPDPTAYLTSADVGRALNITPAAVRELAKRGRLRYELTASGWRLFARRDVEALREERRGADRA